MFSKCANLPIYHKRVVEINNSNEQEFLHYIDLSTAGWWFVFTTDNEM